MAQAGQGPMRRPEEGGWEGLGVRLPRPNKRTISLKSSDGAASLETALPHHLLPLHPHRQGSPPNQPEPSETGRQTTKRLIKVPTYQAQAKAKT